MTRPVVLFVSHPHSRCGVHQFGVNVAAALQASARYDFRYVECAGKADYVAAMARQAPVAVIYNHYPSTLPWLRRGLLRRFAVPHLGIVHEVTQAKADAATRELFDFHIAPDPTLLLRNARVFKTGRLVPEYDNRFPLPATPTIGSFGFGLQGKGFEALIDRVQAEFDAARIRLHIPFAEFGDADGAHARAIAGECAARIRKPGIHLEVTHTFVAQAELLDFLAQNSLNAFFYAEQTGRGIASVIDFALAVARPLAISSSSMFRHVTATVPPICIEHASLREILSRGAAPLARQRDEWCAANLVWDYERIVTAALAAPPVPRRRAVLERVLSLVGATAARPASGDWTPSTAGAAADAAAPAPAAPYVPPAFAEVRFNRILDATARATYRPAIEYLAAQVPDMMRRKIPAANVQQAFVLDSVLRLIAGTQSPAILCIGSFDDTAAAGLRRSGVALDEIDPVLNYDVATYLTKPTCKRAGYDMVFATSVLEHVVDDAGFLRDVGALLRPGGVAVLTCDYDDRYQPGAPHPPEDFRLYTQRDFCDRLLPAVPDLELVDEPRWECADPDFTYRGVRYTFATLVVRKKAARGVLAALSS